MIKKTLSVVFLSLCSVMLVSCNKAFDTSQKDASPATKNFNREVTKDLNWADTNDFELAGKNLIKAFDKQILDDVTGAVSYNPDDYNDQTPDAEAPDTVNPSLWRQARLNNYKGLYKVVDGIYQIRGIEWANLSIVETPNGYVVMDVMASREAAKAAMDLFYEYSGRPKKPVLAMIYSHPHVDHYGGSSSIATIEDVKSGKIKIIAPENMTELVLNENVVVGTAMSRRAFYMYGAALDNNPKAHVENGLTKYAPISAHTDYIPPSILISTKTKEGQSVMIDGVEFVFQMTLETEAPEELNVYIPKYKALWMSETVSRTMHNLLSPRGAVVRNAATWAESLQKSLDLFGNKAEVMFHAHHWPTYGNAELVKTIEKSRNLMKQLHDQTVRMFNNGYKIDEVGPNLKLSPEITKEWYNRPYYGEYRFNARAIYQRYLGNFSGNPVDLNRLPQTESGKRFVDAVGGMSQLMKKAYKAFKDGDYQWAAEMMNYAVMAYPQDKQARYLMADIYEQMGYQAESGVHRNFYLSGAKELRGEIDPSRLVSTVTGALPVLDNIALFNFLGTMVNIDKLKGVDKAIEIIFSDTKTKVYVIVQDSIVMPTEDLKYRKVDETVTLTRKSLVDAVAAMLKDMPYELNPEASKSTLATLFKAIEPPKPYFDIVTSAVKK